jgi:hypothetical protein
MSVSINGTNGLVFNDGSTQTTSPFTGGFGFRNRIINGDMRIDQRNNGASVTITDTGANTYTLDRWFAYGNNASKFSIQQNAGSVTPPAGFANYLGVTSLAATTVASGDQYILGQAIEGFNAADLAWGTASAATITISFKAYSSLTGTFGGALRNSAGTRSYPFTFSVSAANTWETKSITVAGDTSGTWLTNNGVGLYLYLGLGVGSTYLGTAGAWAGALYTSATGATNVVATNGATFYVTGVQLEKGSTATSFDYRPYGTEDILCKRYYQQWGGDASFERLNNSYNASTTQARADIPLVVTMRSAPTLTVSSASNWAVEHAGGTTACTSISLDQPSTKVASANFNVSSGLTSGQGSHIIANNTTSARFNLTSEL